MSSKVKIIEKNRLIGGYTLSVRDNWVYKIKKIHINEVEKQKYIETFSDNKIITYDEFFDWYKNIKKQQKEFISI